MSKKRDPKDAAIEFVLTQSVESAAMFVSTLASIVKARQSGVQLAGTKATPQKAAQPAKPRAVAKPQAAAADKPGPRAVAPEELEGTTGSAENQAQPDNQGVGLPLN